MITGQLIPDRDLCECGGRLAERDTVGPPHSRAWECLACWKVYVEYVGKQSNVTVFVTGLTGRPVKR